MVEGGGGDCCGRLNQWFGRNSRKLHTKAVRGSGRVGLLVREEVLERFTAKVLEADVEDVLRMRLSEEEEECLVLVVCHIPPESSSRREGQKNMQSTLTLIGNQKRDKAPKDHRQGEASCISN